VRLQGPGSITPATGPLPIGPAAGEARTPAGGARFIRPSGGPEAKEAPDPISRGEHPSARN